MSVFKVNVTARNPKSEELATQPMPALVDTGSELTWLPGEVLKSVGITPRRKRTFATATQQRIEREVGQRRTGSAVLNTPTPATGHPHSRKSSSIRSRDSGAARSRKPTSISARTDNYDCV